MDWREWWQRNEKRFVDATPYERLFVTAILQHVGEVTPATVQCQLGFTDSSGRSRYMDFAIAEGKHVRIAIEVDGYDKTGRGTGMTREEFTDWSSRELSLVRQGWLPLRFANGLVMNDPVSCRRTVETVLKQERAVAERLEAAASDGISVDKQETRDAVASEVLSIDERRFLEESLRAHNEALRQDLEKWQSLFEAQRNLAQAQEAEARKRRAEAHEARRGRTLAIGLAALTGVALIVSLIVLSSGAERVEPIGSDSSTTTNCDPAYPSVCIAPPPPDLDCSDIPHRRFKVMAPDPHRFDYSDGDGVGCEGS